MLITFSNDLMYLGILVSEKNADASVWLCLCIQETLQLSEAEVVCGIYVEPVHHCRLSTYINHPVADAEPAQSNFGPHFHTIHKMIR